MAIPGIDSDQTVRFECKLVLYYFNSSDELYLPPMRKIDSLLSEQKKRLLRRVSMSAQHQVNPHTLLQMTVRTDDFWHQSFSSVLCEFKLNPSCILCSWLYFAFPVFRKLYIYSPKWQLTLWNLELSKFTSAGRATIAKLSTGSRGAFLSSRSEGAWL